MKRTAGTMMLLAGLGGCASPDGATKPTTAGKPFNSAYTGVEAPGYMGPNGEPVHMTAAAYRGAAPGGVTQAGGMSKNDSGVVQTAGWGLRGGSSAGCTDCGSGGSVHIGGGHHGTVDPYAYGPMGHGIGTMLGNNGIMPVPGMGPAGAVAAIGAIGPGGPMGPTVTNQRTSIKFVNPQNAKITWLGPAGYIEPGLTTPANYNFLQGNVYRLRVSGVPGRSETFYPTLEVAPMTPKTMTFLAHNSVPVAFTDDDFERVRAGNLVVKVIYLPDPMFQDLAAVAGAEEVVSTQLQPGDDPIVEATRRGTILAVIRIGNINLENPNSPAMDAPPGGMAPPPTMPLPAPGKMTPPPAPATMPPAAAPKSASPAPTAGGIKAPATLPNAVKTSLGK